jgi:uncharacterized coiled-coil DUF342 family protein
VEERVKLNRTRQIESIFGRRISADVTAEEDIASVASQLAELTRTVDEMAAQLKVLRQQAASQQERSDIQHERIELAARELNDVSARLQAAATALRESI